MAENRAAFILRRRRSLGFSKCRRLRTCFIVPSRSIFFFMRRNARSTDSPFFNLISVKTDSLPLGDFGIKTATRAARFAPVRVGGYFCARPVSTGKKALAKNSLNPNKQRSSSVVLKPLLPFAGSPATGVNGWDAAFCASPWLRSGGCVRE